MSRIVDRLLAAAFLAGLAMQPSTLCAAEPVGLFEDHGDVGVNPRKGSVEFDATASTYKITGGGANMWADTDAFHFVWKKISGDVALTADVELLGQGAVAHRKAGVIIRQSLDANSAYADAIVHGDGSASLQYRTAAGEQTKQVESPLKGAMRLRIERRGDQFTMYAGAPQGKLTASGPVTVTLSGPVYVGLAVCAHDAGVLETALFSSVRLESPPRAIVGSNVSIYDLASGRTEIVYTADQVIEAPSWPPDSKGFGFVSYELLTAEVAAGFGLPFRAWEP